MSANQGQPAANREEVKVKTAKLVLLITMVLSLTLVVKAQRPQQDKPQPSQPQVDDNRMEEAHGALFQGQQKAKDASRLTEAVAAVLPRTGVSGAPVPRKNYVDEHVFGRIERDGIPHAPLAGDAEFMRRAYLDATGLLPTADQARAFLADTDPNKRDKLIDKLISTEEFADQWAYHFAELLRTDDARFHLWTKQWIRVDRPYNEVFYDIITPSTKYLGGEPAGMYFDPTTYTNTRCITVTDSDHLKAFNRLDWIDEVTSEIGRVFLGVTMDCFSCHNGAGHADTVNLFLASMKRSDFWQQAAFFGNLRPIATGGFQNGSPSFDDLAPGYNTKEDGNYYTPAEARFPRDGRTYEPAFFLTGEKPKPGETPRKALGRILPTHIQFARTAVNIAWQKLMVVGLVEPYDGFDLKRLDPKNPPPAPWTIQPSNPELLDALAQDFRKNNYSWHHVIKTIMKSNAYQLSTAFDGEWKDAYISYHARRFARILSGPEAADVVAQATDTTYAMRQYGQARGYVKELTNPANMRTDANPENKEVFAFMQAYYQAERALPPSDKSMANAIQAMMMMSSPVVTKRVDATAKTRVASLLASGKSDDQIIEELVLTSLSRFPTAGEIELGKRLITEKGRTQGVESIQWVLLNNPEFLLNH
jgi:hypothetical protein